MQTKATNIVTYPPTALRSIPISVSVCLYVYLSVCPLAYFRKRMPKLYEIFCIHVTCAAVEVIFFLDNGLASRLLLLPSLQYRNAAERPVDTRQWCY